MTRARLRRPRPSAIITVTLTFLATVVGMGSVATADTGVEAVAYGSFRIVRTAPGTPSAPEIQLAAGYSFVPGPDHQVASRLEFYSFIQGPSSSAVTVTVRWPGVPIETVVSRKARPTLNRDDAAGSVTFSVPVTATSAAGARDTLEIFSYVHRTRGTYFRLEHNDPDRAAGYYATVPWVGAQSRAAYHQLFAAEAALIDSGLAAEAQARGHTWTLMGFETNNRLHPDNPPHWHLAYYPGAAFSAGGFLPHLMLDPRGRNTSNGMDQPGGRVTYSPGVPAPIRLPDGTLVATLTVRADGGLDIDPGRSRPIYSITGADAGQDLTSTVRVLRGGQPWLWLRSRDDVKTGTVWVDKGLLAEHRVTTTRYRYDHQLGTLRDIVVTRVLTATPLPPPVGPTSH
ncbi:hypothetical protein RB614_16255 [Phytohabitans sp. ZYX-F-186]|uniref:Uncharacterized protein n=1 Tax=Phytohabitans maris TaxID=3071409 RepID=A0ABU0ZHS3_9ACTN|nr:hypothetical protein [Phytohabitans sp. ZYX-F-186]MDQ7906066.1 hypothetical protein [Phytohabitans sp. ZYX-F-186]